MNTKKSIPRYAIQELMLRRILYLCSIAIILSSCNNQNTANSANTKEVFLRDTLVLKGYFADCGEWGGHHETFNIYKLNLKNELGFTYERDTVKCYNPQMFNRRIVERINGHLSSEQWEFVDDYINDVLSKSFEKEGPANSANGYTVSQKGYDYWYDSIPMLNIRYSNYRRDWDGFEILKDKLLPNE